MKLEVIEILMAEDDLEDQMLVKKAFREARVVNNLRFVNDGEELLKYLRHQAPYADAPRPDLLLLDLNMPGISGLVVLPDLLALAPAARLVVLTGYSSIVTAVEATKAGATNYLCKPATIDEVLAAFADQGQASEQAIPGDPISVDRLEWEHIQRVLQDNNGNVSATARSLGMHRRTLQRKLQKRPVRR